MFLLFSLELSVSVCYKVVSNLRDFTACKVPQMNLTLLIYHSQTLFTEKILELQHRFLLEARDRIYPPKLAYLRLNNDSLLDFFSPFLSPFFAKDEGKV